MSVKDPFLKCVLKQGGEHPALSAKTTSCHTGVSLLGHNLFQDSGTCEFGIKEKIGFRARFGPVVRTASSLDIECTEWDKSLHGDDTKGARIFKISTSKLKASIKSRKNVVVVDHAVKKSACSIRFKVIRT